jgi:uncharacterized protein involved in exopolysaccharide biosynthesis
LKRYLRTFLRHPFLYLLPLILVMIGAAILAQNALRDATPYTALATVAVNLDPTRQRSLAERPPAQQHAELLAELMRTDRFIMDVVARISLEPQLSDVASESQLAEILRTRWRQSAVGQNTLRATMDCADPRFCTDFIGAVLSAFRDRIASAQLARRTATLEFYQQQAQTAEQRLANLPPTDPGYVPARTTNEELYGRLVDARLEVTLATQGVADGFQIIAPPHFQRGPRSPLITAGTPLALGGALGLLVVVGLVVIMTWTDSRLRTPTDSMDALGLRTLAVVGNGRRPAPRERTVPPIPSDEERTGPLPRIGRR